METRFLHGGLRFGIFHEGVPHKTCAVIFRHEHRDAEVDSQHILVVPAVKRIERIHEAVSRPGFLFVAAANVAQDAHAIVEEKGKRAACGARHDAAVDRPLRRRAAPRRVALLVVGRADSPQVFAVVRKFVAERKAEKFVSFRRGDRVLEIVGVGVAFFAEIKPRLRILVREDRIVAGNIFEALVFDDRTRPGFPGLRGQTGVSESRCPADRSSSVRNSAPSGHPGSRIRGASPSRESSRRSASTASRRARKFWWRDP